jgi:Ca2+-binding EF-hand superfamily protein
MRITEIPRLVSSAVLGSCLLLPISGLAQNLSRTGATITVMTSLDKDHDGLVSKSEIYEYFSYRLYLRDTNGDMSVDIKEMTESTRSQPLSLYAASNLLNTFDMNGDGRMSYQEITQRLEASRTFEIMDLSRDGYLSPQEMRIRGYVVQ